MKLIRTITLSHLNISNIELFTLKELQILKNNLVKIYSRNALLINDEHPYELVESSKTLICVTSKTKLIIVKIPIFHTNTYSTHRIYPHLHISTQTWLSIPETHGQIQPLEAMETLPRISTGLSTTSLLLILIILAALLTILIRKKKRIGKILFGPNLQPTQIEILQDLILEATKTSRTKSEPKEGGEM
ncbi:unnamed protein product [Phyllotreta striolata]|uniref:Uncharacterized protein n=1 Tax=Phyllotreta striolata TaxID=444603 RepID=A0A9N9TRF9_PHYSR|nr:unnamed protein product [Phyllotreta striolata]